MNLFWLSLLLIVSTNVSYHVCQKSIAKAAHPLLSVIVTFSIALIASVIILPFFPVKDGIINSLKELNWASYALGLTIIGIEVGYLMLYRSGWYISLGPVIVNVLVILILIPIGVFLYKESLSLYNILGIGLALIGIYLIMKK